MIKLRVVKDLGAVSRELTLILDDLFCGKQSRVCPHGRTFAPQADVYETPEAFGVLVEAPGLRPEDIEVILDQAGLRISGHREIPYPPDSSRLHQVERNYGSFTRIIRLPGPISPGGVKAGYENGVLKIVLPKRSAAKSFIEIE